MFVFVLLLFSLFFFVFIPGQNFVTGSKDTAATAAFVELIIRTIFVLL